MIDSLAWNKVVAKQYYIVKHIADFKYLPSLIEEKPQCSQNNLQNFCINSYMYIVDPVVTKIVLQHISCP